MHLLLLFLNLNFDHTGCKIIDGDLVTQNYCNRGYKSIKKVLVRQFFFKNFVLFSTWRSIYTII